MAAHHPAKISKAEVIHLDLNQKCKEILEFVVNGQNNRPRMSLLLSSHLMYGMVVLLYKKHQYIYEDLIYLKSQLMMPYTFQSKLLATVSTSPRKSITKFSTDRTLNSHRKSAATIAATSRLKATEKQAVTQHENLPDLLGQDIDTSIDVLIREHSKELEKALEMSLAHNRAYEGVPRLNITMEDTFDIYDTSAIIRIDMTEQYAETDNVMTRVDLVTGASLLPVSNILEENALADKENKRPIMMPDTSSNFAAKSMATPPLRERSQNERARLSMRPQQSALFGEQTIPMEFEDVKRDSLMFVDQQPQDQTIVDFKVPEIPELYQESRLDLTSRPDHELKKAPTAVFPEESIAVQPAQTEISALGVSIAEQSGLGQTAARATRVRGGLIVDINTKLQDADMQKRINKMRTQIAKMTAASATGDTDSEFSGDEAETERERVRRKERHIIDSMFESVRQTYRIKTRHDFLCADLNKIPSSLMARRPRTVNLTEAERYDVRSRLLFANMRTVKQPDDMFFYCLPAPAPMAEDEQLMHVLDSTIEQRARQEESRSRLGDASSTGLLGTVDKGFGFSSTRVGSARAVRALDTTSINETQEQQHQYQDMLQPQMYTDFPPIAEIVPARLDFEESTVVAAVTELHIGVYEKLVIEGIEKSEAEGRKVVLQLIIERTKPIESGRLAMRPRRMLAANMFLATLNLCKNKTVTADQHDEFYGPVYLNLNAAQ